MSDGIDYTQLLTTFGQTSEMVGRLVGELLAGKLNLRRKFYTFCMESCQNRPLKLPCAAEPLTWTKWIATARQPHVARFLEQAPAANRTSRSGSARANNDRYPGFKPQPVQCDTNYFASQ